MHVDIDTENAASVISAALKKQRYLLDRIGRAMEGEDRRDRRVLRLRCIDYLRAPEAKIAAAVELRDRMRKRRGKRPQHGAQGSHRARPSARDRIRRMPDTDLLRLATSVDPFALPTTPARKITQRKPNGRGYRITYSFSIARRVIQEMIRKIMETIFTPDPWQFALQGREKAIRYVLACLHEQEITHVVVCDIANFYPSIDAAKALKFIPLVTLKAAIGLGPEHVRARMPSQPNVEGTILHRSDRRSPRSRSEPASCGSSSQSLAQGDGNHVTGIDGEVFRLSPTETIPGHVRLPCDLVSPHGSVPSVDVGVPASVDQACSRNAVDAALTRDKSDAIGLPQGAVCSSIISECVMQDILRWVRVGRPISYADDLVFLCRSETEAADARARLERLLVESPIASLEPRVIDTKTVSEGFVFLGHRFRRAPSDIVYAPPTGRNFAKIRTRLREQLSEFARSGEPQHQEKAVTIARAWLAQFAEWPNADYFENDTIIRIQLLGWFGPPAESGQDSLSARLEHVARICARPSTRRGRDVAGAG